MHSWILPGGAKILQSPVQTDDRTYFIFSPPPPPPPCSFHHDGRPGYSQAGRGSQRFPGHWQVLRLPHAVRCEHLLVHVPALAARHDHAHAEQEGHQVPNTGRLLAHPRLLSPPGVHGGFHFPTAAAERYLHSELLHAVLEGHSGRRASHGGAGVLSSTLPRLHAQHELSDNLNHPPRKSKSARLGAAKALAGRGAVSLGREPVRVSRPRARAGHSARVCDHERAGAS